jgi:DNA-binding transcriptional LysR family regulator
VNCAQAIRDAVMRGLGIGKIPTVVAGPSLAAGELEAIPPEFQPAATAVHAVYPPSRHLSTKVRVWVDFVLERIGDPPAWESGL